MSVFQQRHYWVIAEQIRNRLDGLSPPSSDYGYGARNELMEHAIELARIFEKDSEKFKPIMFLDACSPDPELYPISELWQEDHA